MKLNKESQRATTSPISSKPAAMSSKAIFAELMDKWLSEYTDFLAYSEIVKRNGAYVNGSKEILTFSASCLRDSQKVLDDLETKMNYHPKEREHYDL